MADEAITGCEQCGVGALIPDVHDQWHRAEVGPTAPDSLLATTITASRTARAASVGHVPEAD